MIVSPLILQGIHGDFDGDVNSCTNLVIITCWVYLLISGADKVKTGASGEGYRHRKGVTDYQAAGPAAVFRMEGNSTA